MALRNRGVSPDTIKRFYDGITRYPRFQSVIRMLWGIGFHLVTYKR